MTFDKSNLTRSIHELGVAPDTYGPTLNTLASPTAVETIGRALAYLCGEYRPDRIAVWNTSDDRVLAHIVARELGGTVVRADEVEGAVSFQPLLDPGTRIAVIATAWESRPLRTILASAGSVQAEVVVAAAALGTPALLAVDTAPTASLVSGAEIGLGGDR